MHLYIGGAIEAASRARCEPDCVRLAFNAKRAAEIEHQDAAAQGKIVGRCSAARHDGFLFAAPEVFAAMVELLPAHVETSSPERSHSNGAAPPGWLRQRLGRRSIACGRLLSWGRSRFFRRDAIR